MESPGTAPGSEPRITGAFIAIFPVARNRLNIGLGLGLRKRQGVNMTCVLCACFIRAYGGLHIQNLRLRMILPVQSVARAARFTRERYQKPALISSNSSIILSRKA